MKISSRPLTSRLLAVAFASITLLAIPLKADVYTFTNQDGDSSYNNLDNWSDALGNNAVPNLAGGDTAIISSDGSNVIYTPGGDLIAAGGGTLEISNGSFQQTSGTNYIQLEGNGNILINGGTFYQGTSTSNPFNLAGTGNTFTISSGAANFNRGVDLENVSTTFSWNQTGGTVNIAGATSELNIHNGAVMNINGLFNLADLMNINGTGGINFSGGTFYDGAANYDGWYGPGANGFNFNGTSGTAQFNNNNLAEVQGWVNSGYISYNDTTAPSMFTVTQAGTVISVSLLTVPEPSTYLMFGMGAAFLVLVTLRKRSVGC